MVSPIINIRLLISVLLSNDLALPDVAFSSIYHYCNYSLLLLLSLILEWEKLNYFLVVNVDYTQLKLKQVTQKLYFCSDIYFLTSFNDALSGLREWLVIESPFILP